MPPPFNPSVQAGDRARIVRAHGEMFDAKGTIYALHFQLLKVASIANSDTLRQKVSAWLDHSDMIVSTGFDIVHFEAQIKDRAARGLWQFVSELEATLAQIQARHDAALAAIDRAERDMEEAYVRLVPPGNQGRTRAKLRQIFNDTVRGKGRPKNLPKRKGPQEPGVLQVDLVADADFGGPQQGRKMALTVRRGGGPP